MKRVRQALAYPFRIAAVVCGMAAWLFTGIEGAIADGEWTV